MLGQELRLLLHYVRKTVLEHRRGAGMQQLPPAPQEGAVRRILHQGVLEGVLRIRWCPAPKNQLGTNEIIQCVV